MVAYHLATVATCSNFGRLMVRGSDTGAQHYIAVRHAEALDAKYRSALCRLSIAGSCSALLGEPLAEAIPIAGGHVSYFAGQVCNSGFAIPADSSHPGRRVISGSAIYHGPGAGTHEVHGCIYQQYADAMGGPDGPLGFPISDSYWTPDGSESDFQYGSITEAMPSDQIQVRLGGDTLATVLNVRDRNLEVFAWAGDGTLSHNAELGAGGRWSGWQSLDGNLSGRPVAIDNDDSRLEVFARGPDGALNHIWQRFPGGSWSGWSSMGGSCRGDPAVIQNQHGRLEVFVRGADDALYRALQLPPGVGWSDWTSLGGELTSAPAAVLGRDGRIEVFARGRRGDLQWIRQLSSVAWSGWTSLGGQLTSSPIVQRTRDAQLEVFVKGTDQALWRIAQQPGDRAWSSWGSLGGKLVGSPSIGTDSVDGRLDAFARGTDDALWHIARVAGAWTDWASLGGTFVSDPAVQRNARGQIEVFAQDTDGTYRRAAQHLSGAWSGWSRL
jgi:hypothetical protein